MEDNWIWVTWKGNGRSVYNGKTHKVPRDTLWILKKELLPGDQVCVYWESGKRKFWNAVVASKTGTPAPSKKGPKKDSTSEPPKKKIDIPVKPTKKATPPLKPGSGCKYISSTSASTVATQTPTHKIVKHAYVYSA